MLAEIVWFFLQGRFIGARGMSRWLLLCGLAAALRFGLTAGLGASFLALVAAQLLHALSFAAHHTACVALVSRHFPGRLRGRGQALFSIIGYGVGGVLGVLAGGAIAQRFGYVAMFWMATGLAAIGTACAWRVGNRNRRLTLATLRSEVRIPYFPISLPCLPR